MKVLAVIIAAVALLAFAAASFKPKEVAYQPESRPMKSMHVGRRPIPT